jgi:hypothetical protein
VKKQAQRTRRHITAGEKSMKKVTSTLLILAALLFAPVYPAHAQKQATTPRIGVLYLGAAPNANVDAFIQGLHELRYVEGKNISIEYRFASVWNCSRR